MPPPLLQCPKCRTWLLEGVFSPPEPVPCPGCGNGLQVDVFPAFFRPATVSAGAEAVVIEGEAGCFYHPDKKAVQPCSACGRFLCALCDCEIRGQHFCPGCLELSRQGKIQSLENRRVLYDQVALSLAVYPMFLFFPVFLTAPAVVYIVLRHWNKPRSIVRNSRVYSIIALVLAGLRICGCALWLYWATN